MRKAQARQGCGATQPGSKDIVCYQAGQAGHLYRNRLLNYEMQEPDKDDWNKLVHLMRYIRGTHTMSLILSANGSGILKWWVDVSFAVHPNMNGHSGGGLSLRRLFTMVSSTKH
jgi:hypothetical protein